MRNETVQSWYFIDGKKKTWLGCSEVEVEHNIQHIYLLKAFFRQFVGRIRKKIGPPPSEMDGYHGSGNLVQVELVQFQIIDS